MDSQWRPFNINLHIPSAAPEKDNAGLEYRSRLYRIVTPDHVYDTLNYIGRGTGKGPADDSRKYVMKRPWHAEEHFPILRTEPMEKTYHLY
jgi:hypothetical protein